jgi:glycosyltransferase involved in cell wall biosynthesis
VRLCFNGIVRNEAARIERCLASVVDHISCWAICDTGSDDGTPDLIQRFFAERDIPGEVFHAPFHDFSQARNAALDFARQSTLAFDYLLLCDADMELVVEAPLPDLSAPAYRLIQRGGDLTYWNTRLLQRDAQAHYIGATHEYLSVEGDVGSIEGWWFKDWADGSNRADKYDRDIKLLTKEVQRDPANGRSWYYLSNSFRDAGKPKQALAGYRRCAEISTWDEEVWSARLNLARCLRDIGDPAFEREALTAYALRRTRAEPLLDLARFYREHGLNAAALLFADAGKRIPKPNDLLFVEDDVYGWGFDQEISICGCYLPDRVEDGRAACESLALRRDVPPHVRDQARANLYWYYQPLTELAPSFEMRPVDFTPPEGWNALNPSIASVDDQLLIAQRVVNYTIGEDQRYIMPEGEPIRTRNVLLRLDENLATIGGNELLPPPLPPPLYSEVIGFEDLRIFRWRDRWCANATARELNVDGYAEQILCICDIGLANITPGRIVEWRHLEPQGLARCHQKNWMVCVDGDDLRFIYLCDPTRILDENGNTLVLKDPAIAADNFRGGSQAIEHDGGWLCVIHESYWQPARHYRHRFVWFDKVWNLVRVSPSFYLRGKQIEYVAGLCRHRGDLLLSFGVNDRESWLGSIASADVDRLLRPVNGCRESTNSSSFGPSSGCGA